VSKIIAWFAKNPVAANLLMIFIVVSGAISIFSVNSEVFPEFSLDMVSIQVPYLGAAPEEVEEAVSIRVEEAIQGLDGIKRITSTALEGMGMVIVELELGADTRKVVDDIKSRVDAIDTFPAETEKPIITNLVARNQVVDVAVSGAADEFTLKAIAEQIRDELSAVQGISQVEITSARPYEISIEISEVALRRHGLTFDDVASAVRRSSLDMPGGSVRADSGEILLRTVGQAYRGTDYEELVLLTRTDGTRLHLRDVGTVVDGFAETDQSARFNNEPTILLSVFRTGDQGALEIADLVHQYVDDKQALLPNGISASIWQDQSVVLKNRLDLLLRNGLTGFILVFVLLALFLELRLAFWVSIGIPVTFLGAILLMPSLDVTVNVLSLFAFILVLGIVVDDAIIVGENIHTHMEEHNDGVHGVIEAAQEIATPVIFAVLTTVAAFTPLMFVPGILGKFFVVIPLIVIPCLLFSLVESLCILPAHLAHLKERPPGPWRRFQQRFANGLKWFIQKCYRPILGLCLQWRYLTTAVFISTLIVTFGMVLGGWTDYQFFPPVEAPFMTASVTMPLGSPVKSTANAMEKIQVGAARLRRELTDETGQDYFINILGVVGNQPITSREGPIRSGNNATASHLGEITIELIPSQDRQYTSDTLGNRWRELIGPIPEAVEISFNASAMSPGEDVNIMLMGNDINELQSAADEVKNELRNYSGVHGITDSFLAGKEEIKLGIKPSAEALGLSLQDLGRQVRQAFYGEEAQRIQRGRDDIRVMVRYPSDQRRSLGTLESMRIRTSTGGEVPFSQVAVVEPGRGFASIKRVDRNRAVNVTASVDATVTSAADVNADLEAILSNMLADYPGIHWSFEGMQAEQADGIAGLQTGFAIALLAIFALLAIPLGSYIQPLIIMSTIPFGLVGAVWGHMLMDVTLSMMSMFGLIALSGVVVNDSLVMVTFINQKRAEHVALHTAVSEAGVSRFRPILLTSLTTFIGLAPLMFERSFDAEFLLPMAVSLAYGVLFATFITLILVPIEYLILDDVQRGMHRLFGRDSANDVPSLGEPHTFGG
jgi:multidrug efflux pump subunit AcrB